MKTNFKFKTQLIAFAYVLLSVVFLTSCTKVTDETHYQNINLRIVKINSDCSLTNDKFRRPQLCNTILFETLTEPKLYREINDCQLPYNIHIDTKWIYNHRIGDTVHFDCMLKSEFFTIKSR